MKKLFMLVALLSLLAGASYAQNKVTVKVNGIQNAEGQKVMLAMFGKEGFLRTPVAATSVPVSGTQATIVLDNIAAGEYAIAFYIGQPGIPDFSRGFPPGAYGLSNDPVLTGPPTFELCKFEVKGDTPVEMTARQIPAKKTPAQ